LKNLKKGVSVKIVINKCFGGFSLSKKAVEFMANLGSSQARAELESTEDNSDCYYGYSEKYGSEYSRTDPTLIKAVEVLKEEANSRFSNLKIIEIPDGIDWEITDNDGLETVHEKHRMWS
jgi:hypothetical protein